MITELYRTVLESFVTFPTALACLGAVTNAKHLTPGMFIHPVYEDFLYTLTHINMVTLRYYVTSISTEFFSIDHRADAHDFSSISGADFGQVDDLGWVLQNPNQIIPAGYAVNDFRESIAAFKTLMSTLQPVMANGFFTTIEWNGIGQEAFLASSGFVNAHIESTMVNCSLEEQVRMRYNVEGEMVCEQTGVMVGYH